MQDPRQPGPETPAPVGSSSGKSFDNGRIGRRLRKLAIARLEGDERLLTWDRAWISRDGRYSTAFAARTRDFAVLTDRRLMLWSTGFFTRGPRRRVLTDRLDDLTVEDIGGTPLRMLRVRAFARRPLRFEFSRRAAQFPRLLVELVNGAAPAEHRDLSKPPDPPQDAPWRP